MNRVLVYSFFAPSNKSFKILRDLKLINGDKYYIGSLKTLIKMISRENYDYILGLGDYNKLAKQIRVETIFVNRYGKEVIDSLGREKCYPSWSLSHESLRVSDKETNGNCNRAAYCVESALKQNALPSKHAFLHISSSFDLMAATGMIGELWPK